MNLLHFRGKKREKPRKVGEKETKKALNIKYLISTQCLELELGSPRCRCRL